VLQVEGEAWMNDDLTVETWTKTGNLTVNSFAEIKGEIVSQLLKANEALIGPGPAVISSNLTCSSEAFIHRLEADFITIGDTSVNNISTLFSHLIFQKGLGKFNRRDCIIDC